MIDFIASHLFLARTAIVLFVLLVLFLISRVVWYWPGDDSCAAAQWKRYRAEKRARR